VKGTYKEIGKGIKLRDIKEREMAKERRQSNSSEDQSEEIPRWDAC
jgi:hypothetical protein